MLSGCQIVIRISEKRQRAGTVIGRKAAEDYCATKYENDLYAPAVRRTRFAHKAWSPRSPNARAPVIYCSWDLRYAATVSENPLIAIVLRWMIA
jgi:hypothetical protein